MKGRKEGRKEGKIPIPFSNQFDNPCGMFALSLLLSLASPCILDMQTLPHWYDFTPAVCWVF